MIGDTLRYKTKTLLQSALLTSMAAMVALCTTGARAQQAAAPVPHLGLFGFLEFPSDQLTALPLWRDALARIARDRSRIEKCDADVANCGSTTMTVWRAKVHELQTLDPMRQLQEVNRFVNSFPVQSEKTASNAIDYWASPLEFLRQGGDAEDFAIMKFVTLRDVGINNAAMRIVVVYDALKQQRHAVLAVVHDGRTFILDTVSNAIQPADRVKYYVPFYSVNETTRWAHVVRRRRPNQS